MEKNKKKIKMTLDISKIIVITDIYKGKNMHKPSPSRITLIASIAAAMGIHNYAGMSPAQVLHRQRGKAPKGKKFFSSSIYFPTGETPVRNPKVRANVQMMHERWLAGRSVTIQKAGYDL